MARAGNGLGSERQSGKSTATHKCCWVLAWVIHSHRKCCWVLAWRPQRLQKPRHDARGCIVGISLRLHRWCSMQAVVCSLVAQEIAKVALQMECRPMCQPPHVWDGCVGWHMSGMDVLAGTCLGWMYWLAHVWDGCIGWHIRFVEVDVTTGSVSRWQDRQTSKILLRFEAWLDLDCGGGARTTNRVGLTFRDDRCARGLHCTSGLSHMIEPLMHR